MPEMDRHGVRDLAAPWYAGSPSFLRAPWGEPGEVPEGDIAVVGLPLDTFATSIGRTGMRWGPRQVREASNMLVQYHGIQTDEGLIDILDGTSVRWPERLPVVDTGDVPIVPNDPEAQVAAAARHVRAATAQSSLTVTLGGDHFACYPAALGVCEAWRERREGVRFGYVQVDSHTDFVDSHAWNGRFHHGSGARRASEIPEIHRMAWFGVNAVTQPNQLATMRERGFRAFTSDYVHAVGIEGALEALLEYVLDGVDVLFVTVDIDVVSSAYAPGTGAPAFAGIEARQFLHLMKRIGELDALVGLDLSEVHPGLDPSARTAILAATGLITALSPRIFEPGPVVSQEEFQEVFVPVPD
jgi:agmatinase